MRTLPAEGNCLPRMPRLLCYLPHVDGLSKANYQIYVSVAWRGQRPDLHPSEHASCDASLRYNLRSRSAAGPACSQTSLCSKARWRSRTHDAQPVYDSATYASARYRLPRCERLDDANDGGTDLVFWPTRAATTK